MRTWLVAVAFALAALVGSARRARAEEPASPTTVAADRYARAEAEDARGDYAHAVMDYRATVEALPSFRYAAKATTRAALLEAHAEGGWAPFAELEAVRRDPTASSDPKAIDALAASAERFPPGPTRSEARMLCAEAYLARLHRRADGELALRQVIDDPHADGLLKREAANALVTAQIADGDLARAKTTADALGKALDARMAGRVVELLRRRRVHVASIGDLALFVALAAAAIGRAAARGGLGEVAAAIRGTAPLSLVFAAYVALVGGALASAYETGNAGPFLAVGCVVAPIAIAARAWAAAGSSTAAARAGRAVLSASAVAAAAFLALEVVNGQYLEGFKL